METKKAEEKEQPLDTVELARMASLVELLSEYLRRKFGAIFRVYDLEYDERRIPLRVLYSIYDPEKETYLDAKSFIPKLPDWLRPYATARISTRESYLLLWWASNVIKEPRAMRKVYDGVSAELKAMGPEEAVRDELVEDEDEEEG